MKHIKLRGTWNPLTQKVEVRVLEQTHFWLNFSEIPYAGYEHLFLSDRVVLGSYNMVLRENQRLFLNSPEQNLQGQPEYIYLLSAEESLGDYIAEVPLYFWEKLKLCVNEYNRVHSI